MNIFEWYSLRKKATDHPFFDAHPHMLSKKESDKIVKEQSTMSGKEFVDSIYAELGKERPNSSPEYTSSNREANKSIRTISIPRIRKVAIALGMVLLFVLFFALTPSGRAMADTVIRFVFSVFDTNAILDLLTQDDYSEMQIEYSESDNQPESAIKIFSDATGRYPLILDLQCQDVQYDNDNYSFMSFYNTDEGYSIVTMQEWDLKAIHTIIANGKFVQVNDSDLYYSVDNDDASIWVILILDESILNIFANSPVGIEEILNVLQNSHII